MNCPKCGCEVTTYSSGGGTSSYEQVEPRLNTLNHKHPIPFYCDLCRAIKFPLKPLGDKVFVLSDPVETHIGMIEIPENWRPEKRATGVVMAIGRGYYDKSGRFHATSLKPGMRVIYHRHVPWKLEVEGTDGKVHRVEYMGERDVQFEMDLDFDERKIT